MDKETAFYLVFGILLASIVEVIIVVRSELFELRLQFETYKQCIILIQDLVNCK